jgi:hypothetical protein
VFAHAEWASSLGEWLAGPDPRRAEPHSGRSDGGTQAAHQDGVLTK